MSWDVAGFADPWEHIRLWSDAGRNEALTTLLTRRAPGSRVLEVGCGAGLFSVLAAKLGARSVTAVEPTGMADVARELARHNQVQVEVIEAAIEELEPRPHDLVFSELLNADPFVEGVVEAMEAAAEWVAPGGLLAPSRLRVHVALCAGDGAQVESLAASAQLASLAAAHGLDLAPLEGVLGTRSCTKIPTVTEVPLGPSVVAWDLELGVDEPDDVEVELTVSQDAAVGGVLVWFEAVLDEGLHWTNRPGVPNHWGQLLCGWSVARPLRAGETLTVSLELDDDEVEATLVPG